MNDVRSHVAYEKDAHTNAIHAATRAYLPEFQPAQTLTLY